MNEKTMQKITYGLFVLTTKKDDSYNGCIINTAIQVTSNPNCLSITVNKANYTEELIRKCWRFNISVLAEDANFDTFKRFGFASGRDTDKFKDFSDFEVKENDIPIITAGTNAYFTCNVQQVIDLGTHTMFISKVTDMDILSETPSASYSYYHANIKPKPEKTETKSDAKVWICKICGYTYDDSKEAIPFEELPDDWVCPLCKHPKSDFELQ